MSAKKAADFLFVKSPHTFFLGYYKGAELQPYMNKFKECALTNMSVQYAPDGPICNFYRWFYDKLWNDIDFPRT